MTTTIQIEDKIWKELVKRKRVGETFNNVLERLINNQKTKTNRRKK